MEKNNKNIFVLCFIFIFICTQTFRICVMSGLFEASVLIWPKFWNLPYICRLQQFYGDLMVGKSNPNSYIKLKKLD